MEPESSLHNSPPLDPILSQMNPVHTSPSCCPKNHSNIIHSSTTTSSEWSLPFRFSDQNLLCLYHLYHLCYMPRPSYPPWVDHPNYIWVTVSFSRRTLLYSINYLIMLKYAVCVQVTCSENGNWQQAKNIILLMARTDAIGCKSVIIMTIYSLKTEVTVPETSYILNIRQTVDNSFFLNSPLLPYGLEEFYLWIY